MISTRCCTPTGRSSTSASGLTCESEALGQLLHLPPGAAAVEQADRAQRCPRGPSIDVLGHGEHGHEHEVLVHHADPGSSASPGPVNRHRLAVDEDLALVRLYEPVEHVHQGGLAGAVLAEQTVDLARRDREVDVVVGNQAAKALRDAAQLKFHDDSSADAARVR